jgi:shikimate dehydrogenase
LAPSLSPTLFGVLGDPVDHSLSPAMQNAAFAAAGLPHVYLRYRVAPQALAAALDEARALGMGGLNLTIPLKEVALGLVDRLTDEAQRIGAVNTIIFERRGDRLVGDNTDGRGFLAAIRGRTRLRGQTTVIIGAGGSARAVGTALAGAGCSRIVVANRTRPKAASLVERHVPLARELGVDVAARGLDEVHDAFDVIVNATASSLSGAGVPVDTHVLKRGALACDMMYGPAADGFMRWARDHGAVPRDGLGMLVEQAAEAFLLWRGVRPPSAQVLAELRATLA